jgi:myosin heavy subunit
MRVEPHLCLMHALQGMCFALLSAVLWLGNVEFVVKGEDAVEVLPGPALSNAARQLQVSEQALVKALSTRRITAGGL